MAAPAPSTAMTTVQSLFEAWGSGNKAAIPDLCAADVTIDFSADTKYTDMMKVYNGHGGVADWWTRLAEMEFPDFAPTFVQGATPDVVVVEVNYHAVNKTTGKKTPPRSDMQKWTVKDGKVSSFKAFFHKPEEMDAIFAGSETSKFFHVHHEFKSGEAAAKFWKDMETMDLAKAAADWRKMGMYNHNFLPVDGAGPCFCIWESEKTMSIIDFQKFIDGPAGPGAGEIFDNVVYAVMAGGATPPSAFGDVALPEPKKCGGAVFHVTHYFKNTFAGDAFWKAMSEMDMPAYTAEVNALGFHNHTFHPSNKDGPVFCVWESKEDITVEECEKFLNGPKGVPPVLYNNVQKVMPGATNPSSHFA